MVPTGVVRVATPLALTGKVTAETPVAATTAMAPLTGMTQVGQVVGTTPAGQVVAMTPVTQAEMTPVVPEAATMAMEKVAAPGQMPAAAMAARDRPTRTPGKAGTTAAVTRLSSRAVSRNQ